MDLHSIKREHNYRRSKTTRNPKFISLLAMTREASTTSIFGEFEERK